MHKFLKITKCLIKFIFHSFSIVGHTVGPKLQGASNSSFAFIRTTALARLLPKFLASNLLCGLESSNAYLRRYEEGGDVLEEANNVLLEASDTT
jgi:hypothetical protein